MAVTVANPCNGDGNGCCEDFAWPPGFRFHPTDEELVLYYLKRKICRKKLKLDIIRETDVYKWDPEELPEQSLLKTGDRQWFFFSPRDRKYPNGARSNRATRQGYWKATGKDRVVTCYSRNVGLKKTLVFYRGRAPSGERTDWVMHEYTMDEQELNRCPNVKDYYALYKVFKKSGPGPKNGEQYGAPFREEDWVDDECADSNDSVTVHCSAKQQFEAAPDHSEKIVVPVEQSVDELDELLKQILDAPEFDLSPLSDDTCIETQTQNALANSAVTEVTFHESFTVLPPSDQQTDRDANFLVNQAAASILPSNGRLEVSADNNFGEPPLTVEDFLEMDDLTESQPTLTNINEAGENFQIDFVNENLSVDHFLDAEMLFHDNMFSQADMSPIGPGMENQLENQTMRYSVGHQEVAHLQMQPASSDVNYQFQPKSFFGDQHSNQLEMHDQTSGVFYSPLSNQGTPSTLAPGGAYEVGSSLPDGRQNLAGQQGASATNSRFTSSLWAFLDSIPSTPASASESILMSKTFERMSSFSKLRMNPKTPIVNAKNVAVNAGKAGLNRRILGLSILVALCAILLVVLTGTGKLVVRSISS